MIGTRRRHGWLVAGLFPAAVAGVVGIAWVVIRDPGGPDPGGQILAALRTVERAVPQGADVLLEQASEPRWDSCDGRAGTFGWDDVTVYVEFRTNTRPEAFIAAADRALEHAGWRRTAPSPTPLGPSAQWSHTVAGSTAATATLGPGTRGPASAIYWDLDAVAPPRGQRASGC